MWKQKNFGTPTAEPTREPPTATPRPTEEPPTATPKPTREPATATARQLAVRRFSAWLTAEEVLDREAGLA